MNPFDRCINTAASPKRSNPTGGYLGLVFHLQWYGLVYRPLHASFGLGSVLALGPPPLAGLQSYLVLATSLIAIVGSTLCN